MLLPLLATGVFCFFAGFTACFYMLKAAKSIDESSSRREIIGSEVTSKLDKIPTLEELLVTQPEAISVTDLAPDELETYLVCLNQRRNSLTETVEKKKRSEDTTIRMKVINTNN